jgi:hypothetical protein
MHNMQKKSLLLIPIFWLSPSPSLSSENSPEMIIMTSFGMLIIVALVIFSAMKSDRGAEDFHNTQFANVENLERKLLQHVNRNAYVSLLIVRQSGNIERTIDDIPFKEAIKQISQTMRRAKIDTVSISASDAKISIYRTIHNGKGRQEGKRIGGFELFLLNEQNAEEKITEFGDIEELQLDQESFVRIKPSNAAQRSIVIAFLKIYDQFDEYPDIFLSSYDQQTGDGDEVFHYEIVIKFLLIADAYLRGETEFTSELRKEFFSSDKSWQQEIAKDMDRKTVIGAMAFGSTDLHSIQGEMRLWWEECVEKSNKTNSISTVMSPKYLDIVF